MKNSSLSHKAPCPSNSQTEPKGPDWYTEHLSPFKSFIYLKNHDHSYIFIREQLYTCNRHTIGEQICFHHNIGNNVQYIITYYLITNEA